ncbi:MAG TPA: adenylate/guanylate cyclase domain-containing protein [Candidatus Limnocylindrales bacterium]
MTCTACGSPNPAGRKFCGQCGARLALACATCGAALDESQKFCGECGTPTAGPAVGPATRIQPAQPGAVAERRLVSVLFADLVGFTPFSEERDSEEVRETLTRYFDIASEVIGNHGGTVEKFIGDAVMAVWGTPIAHEDDAERAVRAALELLDAIKGLGLGISARAGVLTGEAAVTIGATNQGMVAGDIVNTAARLQSVALPGTVLVGEATFRAASAAIAFEDAGVQALKGKDEPVATWRALRIIAERGGRNRSDGLEPPFVGRDDELRTLKEAFSATGREGRARLVSITGPAGIGKSRLAWEFEKYLDGVVEDVWWHHGRSPAYGQGITFWALGEMVRARCGITESADAEATRTAVDAMLERYIPLVAERAWIAPAILALLGIEADKVAADELFARWRLLFERMADTGTVALVFEDLHWADPATLDFIDHLLDWSKQHPIFVVTLARPELLDNRPDWGVGRRSFVGIALDPLADDAVRQLLLGVAPGLPPDAVSRIVARAEGMPLYAVETIRMLVADRRLVLQGDEYVVSGDVADIAVPETLTALIAARLDALDPGDRALVLDASVLGQSFVPDGLAAVSGLERDAVEGRLRTLVRRELITLEADPRSPERGQYAFVQALIREVAYNTLAKRDRKERHLAAARYFEAIGSDELAGALAGHYVAAYENAPAGPEADALAAQARIALRAAADRAFALASFQQAVALLEAALKVAHDPGDRAAVLERMGTAASMSGRHGEAIAWLAEALQAARAGASSPDVMRVSLELGRVLIEAGSLGRAREVLQTAESECGAGDPVQLAAIRSLLARALMMSGHSEAARVMADQVLELAEAEELWPLLADTLVTKAGVYSNSGRAREARALLDLGLSLAEEHGLLNTRFRALYNRCGAAANIDMRAALESAEAGLALARRMGLPYWEQAFVGILGQFAVRRGAWDLAERELRPAMGLSLEGTDFMNVLTALVEIDASRGRDVTSLLERLDQFAAADVGGDYGAHGLGARGLAHLYAGRYAEAVDLFQRAAELRPASSRGLGVLAARALAWASDLQGAAAATAAALDAPREDRATDYLLRVLVGALDGALGRDPSGVTRALDALRRLESVSADADAGLAAIDLATIVGIEDTAVASALDDAEAFARESGLERWLGQIAAIRDRRAAATDGRAAVASMRPAAEVERG